MTADLFADLPDTRPARIAIADGAMLLAGFVTAEAEAIWRAVEEVLAASPLRSMMTPGGRRMSVATSSCGTAGWISDEEGYRYAAHDPMTGRPWPAMPPVLFAIAQRAAAAAGFAGFAPDSCLINCYMPGARMSLHQDKNERDLGAARPSPIVSISLGLPANFLFGGFQRSDRTQRYRLEHGDVVVWGGPARLRFHGIAPLDDGHHALLGRRRINLTLRRAR